MWVIELDDRLETDMEFENIQIDEHNNAICTGIITKNSDGTKVVKELTNSSIFILDLSGTKYI